VESIFKVLSFKLKTIIDKIEIEHFRLTGIALKNKTSNQNGQSNADCGTLWQAFEEGDYFNKIPDRFSDEIIAVYYAYEGDQTKPFSYFIGCKTTAEEGVPENMQSMIISKGSYYKITATGILPACVSTAWKSIWDTGITRCFQSDFEIYAHRSKYWNNASVDIFIS
jgi:predicted transcriptional regulator YdeE